MAKIKDVYRSDAIKKDDINASSDSTSPKATIRKDLLSSPASQDSIFQSGILSAPAFKQALLSPKVRAAFLFVFDHHQSEPSHNFYHYLFVASTAADEARKDGFSQEEANIILIASLFHDLFRSSSEVTDKFGEGLSIQLLDEFCRAQNVPEKERKAMIEALEHSKPFQSETASVISRYLQFADFVHFLDPARISSFIIEFLNYHETPLEQIGDIYADKFTRKFKDMSPEIKAKVIDFVQKASDGAISDPIVHAMQVFRKYPFISPPSAENSPEYDSQRLQFGGMPNSLRYNALVNLRELIEMIKDQDENLAHEMNLIFFRRLNEYAIKIPPYLTPLERDAFHHIATRGIRDRSA